MVKSRINDAGTGTGTAGLFPIGTNGQVLTTDLTQSEGLRWATPTGGKLNITWTDVAVVNTTVDTTLISYTVLGGTLSTNNGIRLRMKINGLDNIGAGNSVTLNVKYGGATMISLAGLETIAAKTLHGYVDVFIMSRGATNLLKGTMTVDFWQDKLTQNPTGAPDGIHALADGTSIIDSALNQVLAISAQWNIANAGNSIEMGWTTIEKIS